MISLPRLILCLLLGLAASPWCVTTLPAKDAAVPAAQQPTVPELSQTSALTRIKSPVDLFRELLAMPSAERETFLSGRSPENRKAILEKLQEYEGLKPDERELKLKMTQLHWYMLRFMQTPATNRAAQLTSVPEADREMVRDRLQQWDILPPDLQQEVLTNEPTMQYFVGSDTPAVINPTLFSLPNPERQALIKKLDGLNNLPADKRQRLYAQFQQFFSLTEEEKQTALSSLSPAEREQMEQALQTFAQLPQGRREQCLDSFSKFTSMSDRERGEFLQNAERWQEMSPAERQAWRNLVTRLPDSPPLPPGFTTAPLPMPTRSVQAHPATSTGR
ncbi:MAG: hypothetical protein JWR19_2247 [Pedosphaera sp.]|nr:hypothetical protein [Pedosphaera sp.]